MELSDREKRILAYVHLQADTPVEEVARQCGEKPHTIRRVLERLLEDGVIMRKHRMINMFHVGRPEYGIYLSLANMSGYAEFVERLQATPEIAWHLEYEGRFSCAIGVYTRTVANVWRVLNAMPWPEVENKTLQVLISWSEISRKYLAPGETLPVPALWCGESEQRTTIDVKDSCVISALSHVDAHTMADAARIADMPQRTFQERVERLRRAGVYIGACYLIEPTKISRYVYKLLVYVKGVSQAVHDRLYAFALEHPRVTFFIHALGAWDFEVTVEVESFRMLSEIRSELHQAIPEVSHIETLSVVSEGRPRSLCA